MRAKEPKVLSDEQTVLVMTIATAEDGEFMLVTDADGIVIDHTEYADAGDPIIDYDRKHLQSYEGSMSACVHNILFQPMTHRVSFGELKTLVDIPFQIYTIANVAGRFNGIRLNAEGVKLRERGHEVPLMSKALAEGGF